MSFVALLVLSFFVFQPYYEQEKRVHAEGAPNAVSSELVLDVTGNSADLQFDILDNVGSFASSGTSISFIASTNNVSGYTVKYSGSNDSGALVHEDGGFSFASISAPLTASDFSARANTSYNNQWGFKPSKYVSNGNVINNTGDSGVFLPIPTTAGVVLDKTTAANSSNNNLSAANNYSIEIGARANYDIIGGDYIGELSLAIIANPVSYKITYASNTTDTVSGMPSTQNSSTSDTFITIPSGTPTRDHYTFLAWCDVLPVNLNGIDACTGINSGTGNPATQYSPGGQYGINQTTSNNATLYAMWKIDTFTCTKQYRLENADGTWGNYVADGTETVNYGGACNYSKSLTNYKGSAGGANNSAATITAANVASDQTLSLSLYRNTFSCFRQYRLEDVDGTWSGYLTEASASVRYGGTCSYSKTLTNYRGASNAANGTAATASASNVTSNQTLSLSFYRNVFSCTKQYRLENADGSWGGYSGDGSETVRFGGSCNYSKTVTDYRGASNATNGTAGSTAASNIGSNQILSLSFYRNKYLLTVVAGANIASVNGGGSFRWGQTTTVSAVRASNTTCTTYGTPAWTTTAGNAPSNGASSTFIMPKSDTTVTVSSAASNVSQSITLKLVNAASITLNNMMVTGNQTVPINCGTYNLTGGIPDHYHFTLWSASAGTIANPNTLSTTYTVTGPATVTLTAVIDSYAQTTRYRYENADGTWGSWTTAESVSKNYGSSYSWSTSSISNFNSTMYQAASVASYTVTGVKTNDVSIYRKTFTCTKQYRLQGADATYPSSYTSAGSTTIRYGASCTYTTTANTTIYNNQTKTESNMTANKTISIDVPRKTFTCSKQYRLENANGTWGNYTADGSVTTVYGGSCSYSKTVTDYRGASNAANGAAGSASANNVTSNQTLSISFYRNVYTLTVTAGTNTSSATGGGAYRWGQAATVGVTKATNVTCTSYGTPTWTQSGTTGTFSATSGTSVYFTMGKGNATVTATSAASNVAQTITLSRGTGVASIKIGSTNYSSGSVSLTCGNYSISGNYSDGYEFSSWARANGVAVTNTAAASTTMTVSGAGTLTLNGKSSAVTIASGSTTTMQSVYSKANGGCPSSLPTGTAYQLTDAREGNIVYNVARLADGNCWMLDNLRLGNIQYEPIPLTPNDTNITSNWTLPGSISGNGIDDATVPQIAYNHKDSVPSTGYQGKIGVYYNYCAATAGTYCWSDATYADDPTQDICPKGWRLPTGGPNGELAALAAAYNNDYTTFTNAFHGVLNGYYNWNGVQNRGVNGKYWSSTKYNYLYNYTLSFMLSGNYTELNATTSYDPRGVGYAIRCVLK